MAFSDTRPGVNKVDAGMDEEEDEDLEEEEEGSAIGNDAVWVKIREGCAAAVSVTVAIEDGRPCATDEAENTAIVGVDEESEADGAITVDRAGAGAGAVGVTASEEAVGVAVAGFVRAGIGPRGRFILSYEKKKGSVPSTCDTST